MRALLLAGTLLFMQSGCNAITYMPLASDTFPAKNGDAPVKVIPRGSRPDQEFVLLGRLSARYTPSWNWSPVPPEFIEQMRAKVREVGGDAITDYDAYQAPAGTVGAGTYTIQGNVVRWTR